MSIFEGSSKIDGARSNKTDQIQIQNHTQKKNWKCGGCEN